jgi:hypothetical protein
LPVSVAASVPSEWIDRQPDAQPDPQQVAVNVEIVDDGGKQALGQGRGARGLHPVRLNQNELVAAEAPEEGVSGRLLEAP